MNTFGKIAILSGVAVGLYFVGKKFLPAIMGGGQNADPTPPPESTEPVIPVAVSDEQIWDVESNKAKLYVNGGESLSKLRGTDVPERLQKMTVLQKNDVIRAIDQIGASPNWKKSVLDDAKKQGKEAVVKILETAIWWAVQGQFPAGDTKDQKFRAGATQSSFSAFDLDILGNG